jgi:hypothetical protein
VGSALGRIATMIYYVATPAENIIAGSLTVASNIAFALTISDGLKLFTTLYLCKS